MLDESRSLEEQYREAREHRGQHRVGDLADWDASAKLCTFDFRWEQVLY